MPTLTIFGLIALIAGGLWVLGWVFVIADAITGSRLRKKVPARVVDTYDVIHKAAWASLGIIVLAFFIVRVAEARL